MYYIKNRYYGGDWATFNFSGFCEWLQSHAIAKENSHQISLEQVAQELQVEQDSIQSITLENDVDSYHIIQHWIAQSSCDVEQALLSQSRDLNIDLTPRMVLSRGKYDFFNLNLFFIFCFLSNYKRIILLLFLIPEHLSDLQFFSFLHTFKDGRCVD